MRDHAISLHPVVFPARLAGAKASMLGEFWWLWGLGGGTVHPIICRIRGGARWTGHGLWIGVGGVVVIRVVVGIRGIEEVPSVCVSIQFKVGVASLIIIGHRWWGTWGGRGWDVGTFMWEFKG